ncbi:hypothetical protein GF373_13580 [bacterium]|nr:hypothetical protein [bacterium]
MKMLYQNALYSIPIFLTMVAVIGFSQYVSERRENLWSAQNELQSFSIAIAELVNPYVLEATKNEKSAFAKKQHTLASLQTVFSQGLMRSLQIIEGEGKHVLFQWGDSPIHSIRELLAMRAWRGEKGKGTNNKEPEDAFAIVSPFRPGGQEDAVDTMAAIAPVYNGKKQIPYYILIEKDVSNIAANDRQIFREILYVSGLVIVLGFLASMLLSFLVNQPIQTLYNALTYTADHLEGQPISGSRFREFNELSHTYNTMVNVLGEATNRINLELVEGEQFATPYDYAKAYVKEFCQPRQLETCSADGYGQIVGFSTRGFYHLSEEQDKIVAFVGQIDYVTDTDVDIYITEDGFDIGEKQLIWNYPQSSILSSAVCSLLTRAIREEKVERLCQTIQALASLRHFQCLILDPSGFYEQYLYHHERGHCAYTTHKAHPRQILLLHTFDRNSAERLNQYIPLLGTRSAENIMKEAVHMIEPGHDGAMVILRYNP